MLLICKYVCRCCMHAFGLLLGSILCHFWAAALVKQAQVVVTYFGASHRPWAMLLKEAARLGTKKG